MAKTVSVPDILFYHRLKGAAFLNGHALEVRGSMGPGFESGPCLFFLQIGYILLPSRDMIAMLIF